jgi:hypothetical protein
LAAGRTWLALTITALRLLYLLPALLMQDNASVQEMVSLQRIRFLGEWVTVRAGVTNPFQLFAFFGTSMILAFVADAGITAWRRGDRRKALVVGGSTEFFMFTALLTTMLVMPRHVAPPDYPSSGIIAPSCAGSTITSGALPVISNLWSLQ